MKVGRKTRAANRWDRLTEKIVAGDISFNTAGEMTVYDGEFLVVPARLVGLAPSEQVAVARDNADRRAEESRKKNAASRKKYRAEQAKIEARIDEAGFCLIAGEDSCLVFAGTLRNCRRKLPLIQELPRDYCSGRGCWVIVDSDGAEIETGLFDKDLVW